MKAPLPYLALAAAVLLALLAIPSSSSGDAGGVDPAIVSLVNDVAAQQTTITDNQAKIDEKLAQVAEDVRQARIFASRGK